MMESFLLFAIIDVPAFMLLACAVYLFKKYA